MVNRINWNLLILSEKRGEKGVTGVVYFVSVTLARHRILSRLSEYSLSPDGVTLKVFILNLK